MKSVQFEQFKQTWLSLGGRRQAMIVGVFLAAVLVVLLVTNLATRTEYALLYAGLEPAAAGEVVTALEQQGVAHQVRASGIFVDARQRDRLRISLASDGLPSAGGGGYELLDNLSGFGTTSQMFDVTYRRAKEGELARTIAAGSAVKSARVLISAPIRRGFQVKDPGSASVFVTPSRGRLTPAQVEALQFLVSSAVAGMSPDQVTVVDSVSGMLLSDGGSPHGGDGELELADRLQARVERLLEARVGRGNAIVEVNVTSELDRERVVERRFDPDSRVAISMETTENNATSSRATSGAVTVASNLPDGDAATPGGQDNLAETETRERVNYEVSETTREIERGPGTIKRLTVAVLVNGLASTSEAGETQVSPRPADEMEALEELVKSAVGFDEARGDVVTLRSMEMPQAPLGGETATNGFLSNSPLNLNTLLQIGLLGATAVAIGMFVVRPVVLASLTPRLDTTTPDLGLPSPVLDQPQVPERTAATALDGEISGPGDQIPPPDAQARIPNKADAVLRLREQMRLRKADSVAVLQSWVEDTGEVR